MKYLTTKETMIAILLFPLAVLSLIAFVYGALIASVVIMLVCIYGVVVLAGRKDVKGAGNTGRTGRAMNAVNYQYANNLTR